MTHRKLTDTERSYIIWQNRALGFYLASRLLHSRSLFGPASFCAQQTLELLLKATLLYWDKSFKPRGVGHSFRAMLNTLRNKVKGGKKVEIPSYFYTDDLYQSVSRYHRHSGGNLIPIPQSFVDDLDRVFCELVQLVPFQFNSALVNIIGDPDSDHLPILESQNLQVRHLRQFLEPWLKKDSSQLAPFPREFDSGS